MEVSLNALTALVYSACGPALDVACREEVSARAEVDELALLVEADLRILRKVDDELDLVDLAPGLQVVYRILPRHGVCLELEVLLHDLLHLGLDLLEVVGDETALLVEIVVESVVNSWSDCQFGSGVQPLHRLSHNMGSGVPEDLQRVLAFLYASVAVQSFHFNHFRPVDIRTPAGIILVIGRYVSPFLYFTVRKAVNGYTEISKVVFKPNFR